MYIQPLIGKNGVAALLFASTVVDDDDDDDDDDATEAMIVYAVPAKKTTFVSQE